MLEGHDPGSLSFIWLDSFILMQARLERSILYVTTRSGSSGPRDEMLTRSESFMQTIGSIITPFRLISSTWRSNS